MEQPNERSSQIEEYKKYIGDPQQMMHREFLKTHSSGVVIPYPFSVKFNPKQNPNERNMHWFFLDVR